MPYLAFQNNSGRQVSVAVMQEDVDACGEYGNWATHGWWNLNPGEEKTAIYTKYDAAYFYAEAADGTWWGDPNGPQFYVDHPDKFDGCIGIGVSTWDVVEAARVDLSGFILNKHIVNLNVG